MASKTVFLVLACLLLVYAKVSSELENEMLIEGGSLGPGLPSPLPPVDEADAPLPQTPPVTRLRCIKPCLMRCKFHLLKMKCISACLTCCNICKCVPPGPFGNKEECGKCYTDMITLSGKPKCP